MLIHNVNEMFCYRIKKIARRRKRDLMRRMKVEMRKRM